MKQMDAIIPHPAMKNAANTSEKSAPSTPRPSKSEAEDAVRTLLRYIGEDITREGLLDTPSRVVKAYDELFRGYGENAKESLERVFEEVSGYDDMVLVRNISFHSHCEHHMVPFVGNASIAYYPRGGVVGLSKIARVVETYARRLQTQENLTAQIASALEEVLDPQGVAVLIEAEHMCMTMRGVQKAGASTITTRFSGRFAEPQEQIRFITLLRKSPI